MMIRARADEINRQPSKFASQKAKTIEYRFLTSENRPKQGVGGAEQAQATNNDYATVARSWDEYVSLAEAAIFEYAFRLGARLTMEIQKDTDT